MGESLAELRLQYKTFLQDSYRDQLIDLLDDNAQIPKPLRLPARLLVDYAKLEAVGYGDRLIGNPFYHLRAMEGAAQEILDDEQRYGDRVRIGIAGPLQRAASPRDLNATSLRKLVCIQGVATKVSSIKPKIVRSDHYCPETKAQSHRQYVDATDPQLGLKQLDADGNELPDRYVEITSSVYPTKDEDNHPLETEYGLSEYKDYQTIRLQEMPESAPMGQLPRSTELILDHDLVDTIKPGDRVQIVGVYRALAHAGRQNSSGIFATAVLVNAVRVLGNLQHNLHVLPTDARHIRNLAQRPNILEILGRSVAPSIHGHEIIKQAIALQLLSGMEKNLENGTHLRGDINILMVGDPSTAKSQLLRSAMAIAPLAVSTTGKGSSGVGLTAAVTSDPDTRERRLEAGAMVLADRGLVCVDEFDKMGENDRVALHEAMEQQTVTISKAGIHASLNARCSVLAAANPVYGQYDTERRIQENIGLPDSLLSRFDLLFIVLDQMDAATDRSIAQHVLKGHQMVVTPEDDDDDENPSIWRVQDQVLRLDFLRKYLHMAKTLRKPKLTDEARNYIATSYSELRNRQTDNTVPITARSLETVIRLATAHAKARLGQEIEIADCQVALGVLTFALYHETAQQETVKDESPKRKRLGSLEEKVLELLDTPMSQEELSSQLEEEDDLTEVLANLQTANYISADAGTFQRVRPQRARGTIESRIWEALVEDATAIADLFEDPELEAGLQALAAANRITVSEGMIYKH